jgi:hypothetical protein
LTEEELRWVGFYTSQNIITVIDSGVKVSVGHKTEGGNDLHRGQRESNKQTRGMNYFADK